VLCFRAEALLSEDHRQLALASLLGLLLLTKNGSEAKILDLRSSDREALSITISTFLSESISCSMRRVLKKDCMPLPIDRNLFRFSASSGTAVMLTTIVGDIVCEGAVTVMLMAFDLLYKKRMAMVRPNKV
jgi:hypothetical protein